MEEERFETPYGTVTASIESGSSGSDKPKNGATDVSVKNVGAIQYMLNIPHDKIVCIDIETTGLRYSSDEILQVAICNGNGKSLFNSYVKPAKRKRWPEAQKVNGITYEMVENAPSIENLSYSIERILNSALLIVGYNIKRFDFEFLKRGRVNIPTDVMVYDLINDCSVTYGKWSDYYENYSFVSLKTMTERYGIKYNPHDAGSDAVATIAVFYHFLNDTKFISKVSEVELRINEEKEYKEKIERAAAEAQRQVEIEEEKKKEAQEKHARQYLIGCALFIIFCIVAVLGSCMAMCSGGSSRKYSRTRYETVSSDTIVHISERR